MQSSGQLQLLVEDSHHQVHGYRDPDLGLHRVGTCFEVVLDVQVALDPEEEQFDLQIFFFELDFVCGRQETEALTSQYRLRRKV